MSANYLIILLILIAGIAPAYAESGTLNIVASIGNSYTSAGSSGEQANYNYSAFAFSVGDYNRLTKIELTLSSKFVFAKQADSTSFTVNTGTGNSGSGTVSYDAPTKKVIWYFFDTIITSSPVTLTYSNTSVMAGITVSSNAVLNGATVSSTAPVKFYGSSNYQAVDGFVAGDYTSYIVQSGKVVVNSYNVTYSNGVVTIAIIKSPETVQTKIKISNESAQKFLESSYNTANFTYAYMYDNMLLINMSDVSGNSYLKYVNTTRLGATSTTTTGTINFNKSVYPIGEQQQINYSIVNGNFSGYDYSIEFYDTTGVLSSTYQLSSSIGFILPTHSKTITGTYSAWLREIAFGSLQKNTLSVTTAIYGGSTAGIIGNISVNKTTFNRTETAPIKFNISVGGRIMINTPTTSLFYSVNAGTGQTFSYYFPVNAATGSYNAMLQYYDGLGWVTLGVVPFSVSAIGTNTIEFTSPRKIYLELETMTVNAIATESGIVKIIDSNSRLVYQGTITAGVLTSYNYFISTTDPTGIYTANLYNSTSVLVGSDYADVYTTGFGQVNPTVAPTAAPPGQIDYVGNATAKKAAENSFFNTFYNGMNSLFTLAILTTMIFFLKLMSKW